MEVLPPPLAPAASADHSAHFDKFLSIFILYTMVSTVGFNSLFLYIIVKTRKSTTYSSLACLCGINLFTGLCIIPFSLAVHFNPALVTGGGGGGERVSCQVFGVMLAFHHRVSMHGFCLLQLER